MSSQLLEHPARWLAQWALVPVTFMTMPPRHPNDDEDDEDTDDDDDNEPDEPAVVREPDEE
jgi:hypothetical protein